MLDTEKTRVHMIVRVCTTILVKMHLLKIGQLQETGIRRGEVNYDLPYERDHPTRLFACRGYLLLVQNKTVYVKGLLAQKCLDGWVDGYWVELQPELGDVRGFTESSSDMMCELQWDAVP